MKNLSFLNICMKNLYEIYFSLGITLNSDNKYDYLLALVCC